MHGWLVRWVCRGHNGGVMRGKVARDRPPSPEAHGGKGAWGLAIGQGKKES